MSATCFEAVIDLDRGRAAGRAAEHSGGGVIDAAFDTLGTMMFIERNAEIFSDEEPADYVYRVVSGTVRCCKFLEDGRRQIEAFHFAGDLFGFEPSARHSFSAEAVTPCRVLLIRRTALVAAAEADGALASALWLTAAADLQRLNAHLVMLGRKSAVERVLEFLQVTACRLGSPTLVDIPMSRQDIADHLGLTIETVSRTMTQLQDTGAIALEGLRRVRMKPQRLAA